ncbi:MAG: DinB family protein [Chloroflexales bacterium]
MNDQLISLYAYGVWVNQRLLDAAAALTDAQFTQRVLPGFGSVHLTLVHILGAEALWFARWQGLSPTTMLAPSDLPTLPTIRARWAEVSDAQRANLAGLDEAALSATVQWRNMRGQAYALPRWQVILHAANHATHHRSEVAAMLTELGHEPASTDLLEFYLEQAGQAWKPTSRS